jgi:hypothetical protein
MTNPAIPINEAAERYSPEIAAAFSPTPTRAPGDEKVGRRLRLLGSVNSHTDSGGDDEQYEK